MPLVPLDRKSKCIVKHAQWNRFTPNPAAGSHLPEAMSAAAAESAIRVAGKPSCTSSYAVSRAPEDRENCSEHGVAAK
jgi:hypothetical protein